MNATARFFGESLHGRDPVIAAEIALEMRRQQNRIELLASGNIVSAAVLEAQGTVLTNHGAEGYPGRRGEDGGCEHVDRIEALAGDRVKALFEVEFANVQPHSGAQARGAAMLALARPGDTVMHMLPDAGAALSAALPNERFDAVPYGVRPTTLPIDYDAVRDIADSVGARLMVDMAQIAGIVVAGRHRNPLRYADVVTSTTHRTLRGPRGGFILTNDGDLARQIDAAVFPGLQCSPLMHVIAGKAVAFGEALRAEFRAYIGRVLENAQALGRTLLAGG